MKRTINEHLKDIIRQEIKNTLSENRMSIGKGVYSIRVFSDRKGIALAFLPDSKTLDIPVNTQVNDINEVLNIKLGPLGKAFYFESGHEAAGRIYRLNNDVFTDIITKMLS
jgi:hypothetical protein